MLPSGLSTLQSCAIGYFKKKEHNSQALHWQGNYDFLLVDCLTATLSIVQSTHLAGVCREIHNVDVNPLSPQQLFYTINSAGQDQQSPIAQSVDYSTTAL